MQTTAVKTPAPAVPEASPALAPLPTTSPGFALRRADFPTLVAALDYAARGVGGLDFYNGRGVLASVLPHRDLRDQAVVMAGKLAGAGVKPGEKVALLAATHPDFLVMFFGCLFGGIIPVPLPLPTAFGR